MMELALSGGTQKEEPPLISAFLFATAGKIFRRNR
jgi:hypothetical protein